MKGGGMRPELHNEACVSLVRRRRLRVAGQSSCGEEGWGRYLEVAALLRPAHDERISAGVLEHQIW